MSGPCAIAARDLRGARGAARAAAVAAVCAAAACAEPVSPEPPGDYTAWKRIDVTGQAPGHGDTYRIIYVNAVAADPLHDLAQGYRVGSILVKEIRDNDSGAPGALRYVALMRRESLPAAPLAPDGGWLFSESDVPNGPETSRALCWARCHVAAPLQGAWYDYRR